MKTKSFKIQVCCGVLGYSTQVSTFLQSKIMSVAILFLRDFSPCFHFKLLTDPWMKYGMS